MPIRQPDTPSDEKPSRGYSSRDLKKTEEKHSHGDGHHHHRHRSSSSGNGHHHSSSGNHHHHHRHSSSSNEHHHGHSSGTASRSSKTTSSDMELVKERRRDEIRSMPGATHTNHSSGASKGKRHEKTSNRDDRSRGSSSRPSSTTDSDMRLVKDRRRDEIRSTSSATPTNHSSRATKGKRHEKTSNRDDRSRDSPALEFPSANVGSAPAPPRGSSNSHQRGDEGSSNEPISGNEDDSPMINAEVAPRYEDQIEGARDRAVRDVEHAHKEMLQVQVATQESRSNRIYYIFGVVAVILAGGVTAAVLLLSSKDNNSENQTTIMGDQNNVLGDQYNILEQYFVENTIIQVFEGGVDETYTLECAMSPTGVDNIGVVATNSTSGTQECVDSVPFATIRDACEATGQADLRLEGEYNGLVLGLGFLGADNGLDCTNSSFASDGNSGLVFEPPTYSSTPAPTNLRDYLEQILADHAPLHEQAMDWLVNIDTWTPGTFATGKEGLWKQRYALAVFLFQKESGWSPTYGSASVNETSVCEWTYVTCAGNDVRAYKTYFAIAGTIPPELGLLSLLTSLDIHGSQLSGTLPSEIGRLTALSYLKIYSNENLQGRIPSEIGNMRNLRSLELHENNLAGAVPSEVGSLSLLTHLDLQQNLLSGSIPSELGKLTRLTTLTMTGTNNVFSQQLPSELGQLTKLRTFQLPKCDLTGTIPTELGFLTLLDSLLLHQNRLEGPIPSELGKLTVLNNLQLYDNRLTGSLPSQVGQMALTYLKLQHNELSGSIPPVNASNGVYRSCDLSHNKFTDGLANVQSRCTHTFNNF